jgi:hypothetical protein
MLFRRAIGALRRAHLDHVLGMATESTRIGENCRLEIGVRPTFLCRDFSQAAQAVCTF